MASAASSAAKVLKEEEEEEEEQEILHSADGLWFRHLHEDLSRFCTKLKNKQAVSALERTVQTTFPDDVIERILSKIPKYKSADMHIQMKELPMFDAVIKHELNRRLKAHGIAPTDNPYTNVVNYARATHNMNGQQLMLWLGTTDYDSMSGGHYKQLHNLKARMPGMRLTGGQRNRYRNSKLKSKRKSRKMRKYTMRRN